MGFKSTKTSCLFTAFNFEPAVLGKEIPDWWEIIPAGEFSGLDDRRWENNDPQGVIDQTLRRGRDVIIDINHSTQLKGEKGEPAPAQGKISATAKKWEVRNGAVWGRPKLNKKGLKLMQDEAYQAYSPVFDHDSDGNVQFIRTLGLTNTQNLLLTALNQESNNQQPKGTESMSKIALAIATALNLEATASEEDAVIAIKKLKDDRQTALNREVTPPLDKFVPTADHNLAIERAKTAEKALSDKNDSDLETSINLELDRDLNSENPRISPATRDHHFKTAMNTENGLENLQNYLKDAPPVFVDSGLDEKEIVKSSTSLNAEESFIADQMGISAEEFAATRKEMS